MRVLRPTLKSVTLICCMAITVTIISYTYFYDNRHIHSQALVSLPHRFEIRKSILPQHIVKQVQCKKLFDKDEREQTKALTFQRYRGYITPDETFLSINCETFINDRRYIMDSMTEEEKDFPIAYSLVVFKDLGQVERLLRAIYRPQNFYCFHVDVKSNKAFREGLKRLVSCFPNIVMSSRSVDVVWGRWSVLEADLICMKDLLKQFSKWKYLINLTGQEFPLRTNLEIVRILKAFNGANNIEGTVKRLNPGRAPVAKPGFKITWLKGSLHIVAVRSFVEFMFKNEKAEKIMTLLRERDFPDEMLFTTLNHNPQLGTPGAYLGVPETHGIKYPFITRLKNWGDGPFNYPCESHMRVRQICIWGIGDLPFIANRPELFINKLYWNFQPLALDCLEERILNHTRRDYDKKTPGTSMIDLEYYRNLPFVKDHQ